MIKVLGVPNSSKCDAIFSSLRTIRAVEDIDLTVSFVERNEISNENTSEHTDWQREPYQAGPRGPSVSFHLEKAQKL